MAGKKPIIIRLSYRRLFLSLFCLLVFAFFLMARVDAPSYQQDGAPRIIYGNESGSAGSLC